MPMKMLRMPVQCHAYYHGTIFIPDDVENTPEALYRYVRHHLNDVLKDNDLRRLEGSDFVSLEAFQKGFYSLQKDPERFDDASVQKRYEQLKNMTVLCRSSMSTDFIYRMNFRDALRTVRMDALRVAATFDNPEYPTPENFSQEEEVRMIMTLDDRFSFVFLNWSYALVTEKLDERMLKEMIPLKEDSGRMDSCIYKLKEKEEANQ